MGGELPPGEGGLICQVSQRKVRSGLEENHKGLDEWGGAPRNLHLGRWSRGIRSSLPGKKIKAKATTLIPSFEAGGSL